MSRRAEPVLLGAGIAVGVGLLGLGAWKSVGPTNEAAVTTTRAAPAAPAPPGGAPVRGGALTWTAEAPAAAQAPRAGAPCEGCDLVLVTVCSLRQDHVGAYGVHPGLTPRIDALAATGTRFTRAYAASNFTLAGLTAILTGRFGSTTGVTGWDKGLVADVPTLPEVLGLYGYRTAAFTVDAPSGFRPDYGLQRGFQRMEILPPPRDTPDGRAVGGPVGPGGASAAPVAAWLADQPADTPVFAMFHSRTAHFPFVLDPPAPGTDPTGVLQGLYDAGLPDGADGKALPGTAGGTAQKGVVALAGPDPLQVLMDRAGPEGDAAWRRAYADAVARMDIDVGVVLDAIAARGRPTVVALVADHGESLNDHGELLHGDAYWDSVVRVPLVVAMPGRAPAVEDALVSHVDLAPTLLELVGAVPPAGIDGASLLPLLQGTAEAVREVTLVEGGVAWRESTIPRGAVIAPPWALLRQDRGCGAGREPPRKPGEPGTCLYDMDADAPQATNLASAHPDVVADLLGRWDAFRAARAGAGKALELDPAYVEELRRTGYDFRVGGK